jgi:hypothetical protein
MSNAPFFNLGIGSIGLIPQQTNFPSAIDGVPKYPWVANIKSLPFVLISNNPNDNADYSDLQTAMNSVGSGIFYVRNTGTPYTFGTVYNTANNQVVIFEAGTQINTTSTTVAFVVAYTSSGTPLNNIYWYGNGAILTLPANSTAYGIWITNNSSTAPTSAPRNIVVDGFIINGNGSTNNLVFIQNAQSGTSATPYSLQISNFIIRNMYLYNNHFSTFNIYGSATNGLIQNVLIDNSSVPSGQDYSALIIHSSNGTVNYLTFINVMVKGNGSSGQVLEIQGAVQSGAVTVTSHLRFIDCIFDTGASSPVSAGSSGPYLDDNNGTSNSAYITNIDFINCQWINAIITYQSTTSHFGYIRYIGSQPQGFSGTLSGRSIGSNNTAITVGTSPFTFTNSYDFPVIVTVSGGAVTAIALDTVTTGATAGAFLLLPNHTLQVTYTTAPTMTAVSI